MSDAGHVWLPRSLAALNDGPFYGNGIAFAVFTWCALRANWKDATTPLPKQQTTLRRGQVVLCQRDLARVLGFGRQQTRTALHFLTTRGFLTLEATHLGTVATVCNYDTLCSPDFKEQPTRQPTANPRVTQSEEGEEKKQYNNNKRASHLNRDSRVPAHASDCATWTTMDRDDCSCGAYRPTLSLVDLSQRNG